MKKVKKKMDFDPMLLAKSSGTGFIPRAIFAWLKLPIPAPSEFASIVGILGVFLGLLTVKTFLH